MRGDFAATVLQEPWITVAEKAGCRLVSTTFFHGTWVADRDISAQAYAAFVRATTRAVRRINADKRAYVSYYIRDFPGYPDVEALTPEDFNLGRIQSEGTGAHPRGRSALGVGVDGQLGRAAGAVRRHRADQPHGRAGGA
jgi:ABC-type nitrate/sulfonate/bicarbonate transport system substrate-binding protein